MPPRELPEAVRRLLAAADAPARLVAHLALVHDAAAELVQALRARWPDLAFDADAVLFGAATHDIGKVLHPGELTGQGSQHEVDGPGLLERHGVSPRLARFARTHNASPREPGLALEDLLVALADTCWKGRREPQLEQAIAVRVAGLVGVELWEVFLGLDEAVTRLADDADERLAWQRAR